MGFRGLHFQSGQKAYPMPSAWAGSCSNFETPEHRLGAKSVRRVPTIRPRRNHEVNAMMIGLTILAVLTFIAIAEIRRAAGEPLKGED